MAKKNKAGTVAVRAREPIEATLVPKSLVASAARIRPGDQLWGTYRFTDETWQAECWRYYHGTPELHYAADYTGSAVSLVRIFVSEIDKLGRVGAEVDDDEEIMALADTLFGGPSQKAEALRAIGSNLTIAGECFIVGRASRGGDPDAWKVVSTTELRRRGSQITIDYGYGPEVLVTGRDIIIRLWNPNPQRMAFADSSTRACMDVLWELEQLSMYEQSQIDSRLSGGGVYFIPSQMAGGAEGDGEVESAADDIFTKVAMAAKMSRTQRGTAGGVVPLFIEVPGEYLKDMQDKPVRFESELSDKLAGMKESAVRRLANGLNMPPEVLLGVGDTANHWSAWHIEESFVKIQIQPMMNRICEGLTVAYLRPLLRAMGKDADRYQLSFDTAPLTVRPNRLQDTLTLYEKGLVNPDAVLRAGDYNPAIDAPTDKETDIQFIKDLMLRDPTLFQIPGLRDFIGIDVDTTMPLPELPAGTGDPNAPGPPPPPAPEPGIDKPNTGPPTQTSSPGGTPILAMGGKVTFALPSFTPAALRTPQPILAAANVVCRRAMELAGGRMLTRAHRGQFKDTPKKLIHTMLRVDPAQAETYLDGAFSELADDFAGLGVDLPQLQASLHGYCRRLLLTSQPHELTKLATELRIGGVLDA